MAVRGGGAHHIHTCNNKYFHHCMVFNHTELECRNRGQNGTYLHGHGKGKNVSWESHGKVIEFGS